MNIEKFFKSVIAAVTLCVAVSATSAVRELPVLKIYVPSNPIYEEYIQGSMTLENTDGSITSLPAKFKTRGATALKYAMKPSLNMKLEGEDGVEIDSLLLGLRRASSFILDAMAIDRICMRNRVCFDIWNSFSKLPYKTDFDKRNGTVGAFVTVYMNDQYKGIYCLSDKINRKLLDLKKPKEDDDGKITIRGVLYKQGTNDISDQNTPGFFNDSTVYVAQYHDAWELHEPDNYPGIAAWQPLVDYYENFSSGTYIKDNFYVDNLVDYSLFVMALCISDNWGAKNKYFSMVNCQGDEDDRRFIVTPWDLDTSLGGEYDGSNHNGNYKQWTPDEIAKSCSSPFSICFSDANVFESMRQRWIKTRETVFAVDSVAKRLYDYCSLFEESGAWQEYTDYWNAQSDRPMYVDNLRAEIDLIVEWYSDRVKTLDKYFNVKGASLTDIEAEQNDEDGIIYNLHGIPVERHNLRPNTIYIRNGKKWIQR